MAAVLLGGAGAVASNLAAGAHWTIHVCAHRPEVTTPLQRRTRPGVIFHQARLPADEVHRPRRHPRDHRAPHPVRPRHRAAPAPARASADRGGEPQAPRPAVASGPPSSLSAPPGEPRHTSPARRPRRRGAEDAQRPRGRLPRAGGRARTAAPGDECGIEGFEVDASGASSALRSSSTVAPTTDTRPPSNAIASGTASSTAPTGARQDHLASAGALARGGGPRSAPGFRAEAGYAWRHEALRPVEEATRAGCRTTRNESVIERIESDAGVDRESARALVQRDARLPRPRGRLQAVHLAARGVDVAWHAFILHTRDYEALLHGALRPGDPSPAHRRARPATPTGAPTSSAPRPGHRWTARGVAPVAVAGAVGGAECRGRGRRPTWAALSGLRAGDGGGGGFFGNRFGGDSGSSGDSGGGGGGLRRRRLELRRRRAAAAEAAASP